MIRQDQCLSGQRQHRYQKPPLLRHHHFLYWVQSIFGLPPIVLDSLLVHRPDRCRNNTDCPRLIDLMHRCGSSLLSRDGQPSCRACTTDQTSLKRIVSETGRTTSVIWSLASSERPDPCILWLWGRCERSGSALGWQIFIIWIVPIVVIPKDFRKSRSRSIFISWNLENASGGTPGIIRWGPWFERGVPVCNAPWT